MHRLNSLQSSTALHTRIAGVRHLRLRFDLLEWYYINICFWQFRCRNFFLSNWWIDYTARNHEIDSTIQLQCGLEQASVNLLVYIVPLSRIARPHRKAGGWQNSINYGSFRVPRPSRNTLLLYCVEKSLKKYRRRREYSSVFLQIVQKFSILQHPNCLTVFKHLLDRYIKLKD